MTEFSTLTTRLVTPLLRQRGFKKRGAFKRSATHDSAVYIRDDLELRLTLAFHPYDYPETGIRMEVLNAHGVRFNRLHPPAEGGIEALLRAVIGDIQAGAGGV
jgi:hypothetical protein